MLDQVPERKSISPMAARVVFCVIRVVLLLDRENKEKDIIIENIRNLLNPTAKPFKFTFT